MYRWCEVLEKRNNIPDLVECIEEGLACLRKKAGVPFSDLKLKCVAPLLQEIPDNGKIMTVGDIAVRIREEGWCQIRAVYAGDDPKYKGIGMPWIRFETMENFERNEAKIDSYIQRDMQKLANERGEPVFCYRAGKRYEATPQK